MRPPVVFRKSRRVEASSYISTTLSSNVLSGALHRPDDAEMCPTPAEIIRQRFLNFRDARVLRFREQRSCLDDHAVDAKAALCGLFVDESLLHRRRPLRAAEALQRNDNALCCFGERRLARKHHIAVQKDGAGAALAKAATEARSTPLEVIAYDVEQWLPRVINRDRRSLA